MSGGGKGGQQSTEVKLDPRLEKASADNLNLAKKVGQIGYMPYRGPTVAALTPSQEAARKNTASAAGAFGMAGSGIGAGAGMPPVETVGGVRGYSPTALYDNAVSQIPPGQLQALLSLFINPQTGAKPGSGGAPAASKQGKGGRMNGLDTMSMRRSGGSNAAKGGI